MKQILLFIALSFFLNAYSQVERKFSEIELRRNIVYIEGDSVTQILLEKKWEMLFYYEGKKKKFPNEKTYLQFSNFKEMYWASSYKDTVICDYKFIDHPMKENNEIIVNCKGGEDSRYLILKLTNSLLQLALYSNKVAAKEYSSPILIRKIVYKVQN